MGLDEIKDELVKKLEDKFNDMSEEEKKEFERTLDDKGDLESYIGSLSNWIQNFDWDGLPRDVNGEDKKN